MTWSQPSSPAWSVSSQPSPGCSDSSTGAAMVGSATLRWARLLSAGAGRSLRALERLRTLRPRGTESSMQRLKDAGLMVGMVLAMSGSWIGCGGSTATAPSSPVLPGAPPLVEPPGLPPWPQGLAPVELQAGGRICMTTDRTAALDERLQAAEDNVGLCGHAIALQAARDDVRLRAALRVKDAEAQARETAARYDAEGWPWWSVALAGMGSGAAGVLLGILVGYTAGGSQPVVVR